MSGEVGTSLKARLGAGRRLTGQRKVIADVVQASRDHPDASEIHRRAAAIDPRISLSTVYRTLKVFAEAGLIEQHSFGGPRARVERTPNRHHDHLIDTTTGRVIEFRSEEIERLQAEIARELGYELTGHTLELYGHPLRGKTARTSKS
ncbi:MAG: transcriptional repressor [Hyphomicrobiaceae bacterium]|nr:transcriptional repressor [Hyphomicrobiaceae bacterium]